MEYIISQFHLFSMVFIRISVIIILVPIFGSRLVPTKLKIALSGLITFIIVPLLPPQNLPDPENIFMFFYVISREVFTGLIIGFATTIIFSAFQYAGTLMGMQMGFGIVNVVDPQSSIQISIIGQFLYIVAILLFLAINGHLFVIQALVESFQIIPINTMIFSEKLVQKIVLMSGQIFVIAIKIGVPTITALLLTTVALGIIARTVPQMNVFIVGFPLNIGLGLFSLAVSFPVLIYLFQKIYKIFQNDIMTIIELLAV